MTGTTRYFIPIMVLVVTIRLASALGLYWLVGGLVAYIQQSIVLREDETELEAIADGAKTKDVAAIPEAEVVNSESTVAKTHPKTKTDRRRKRRKKR